MKKIILVLILAGMYVNAFPQSYDLNYTVEYVLKKTNGNEVSRMKLYRNGDKLKFTTTQNKGTDNETVVDVYIFKNEGKVYTATTGKKSKYGNRHALDLMYVFMLTGVYILEFGNDGTVFNNRTNAGTGTVLGKECVYYNILPPGSPPEGHADYYLYQNNLMLKRFVGSLEEGNSLEALSYDTSEVPESTFVLPTDIQFIDY
jgi:hypothetical protein